MSVPVQPRIDPPLEWPHYGIGFGAAIKRGFTKYATFSGRASRGEYWSYDQPSRWYEAVPRDLRGGTAARLNAG